MKLNILYIQFIHKGRQQSNENRHKFHERVPKILNRPCSCLNVHEVTDNSKTIKQVYTKTQLYKHFFQDPYMLIFQMVVLKFRFDVCIQTLLK